MVISIIILILFIMYIILHPPFRMLTIKSPHKEKDKFIWITRLPFKNYPFFQFNSHYDGCSIWINGYIVEENKDVEVKIK